jgi:hypothetical protein
MSRIFPKGVAIAGVGMLIMENYIRNVISIILEILMQWHPRLLRTH